jgi:hypothetical protein
MQTKIAYSTLYKGKQQMAKDLISFPDLTRDLGGFDLLASAARKAEGAQERKDVFKARVLKKIEMVDAAEIANMTGFAEGEGGASSNAGVCVYLLQIIERSPHSYLPEPCPQGSTSLSDTANNNVIQALYTLAMTKEFQNLANNDLVFVKLNKKDFSYDTDFGWIQEKAGRGRTDLREARFACAKAGQAFKKKKLETVPGGNLADLQTSPDPNGTKFSFSEAAMRDASTVNSVAEFMNMLTYVLDPVTVPEVIISSGYRGPPHQASAMKNWGGGKCKGGVPNGKPTADHPCRAIYNLYGKGTKIQQLLKVDWTKGNDLEREIQEQVDTGQYISKHLVRGAFDLQTPRVAGRDKVDRNGKRIQMHTKSIEAIIAAVKQYGGKAIYESSPPHIHVNLPANLNQQIESNRAMASAVEDTSPDTDV